MQCYQQHVTLTHTHHYPSNFVWQDMRYILTFRLLAVCFLCKYHHHQQLYEQVKTTTFRVQMYLRHHMHHNVVFAHSFFIYLHTATTTTILKLFHLASLQGMKAYEVYAKTNKPRCNWKAYIQTSPHPTF